MGQHLRALVSSDILSIDPMYSGDSGEFGKELPVNCETVEFAPRTLRQLERWQQQSVTFVQAQTSQRNTRDSPALPEVTNGVWAKSPAEFVCKRPAGYGIPAVCSVPRHGTR